MFDLVVGKIIEKAEQTITVEENDYIGEDGLLYCGTCKTPKQHKINFCGIDRTVKCLCKCKAEERDRLDVERKHREKVDFLRKIGFPERDMLSWTFENDDGDNEKVTNALKKYVDNFPEFLKQSKGLMLYGDVGTGKTYGACEIANALIDKGYPCLVTNFARLTNTIQGMLKEKQQYIDDLNKFALIVIDDLGAERKSEFMQEMVFNIIDSRYRSGLPFIVTTNLSMEEIKNPADIGNARIYDRVLERCFPIEVKGQSRRRKAVREGYNEMKDLLGL